jgi:type I restriction enzyme S subunit
MNATQLLEHFDRLAEAPDAVPRLRRFILDLAVRGKLVEQDAGDEPAGGLLKRMQAEKARLVKAGKLKRVVESTADEFEAPFVLPKPWGWAQLGDVAQYGIPDKADSNAALPENTWVLDLEDIEKDTSRLLARVELSARPFSSTKTVFKQGDVLFGKLRPYLNKVVVADRDGVCTTEIVPIRGYCGLVPEYTELVLRSPLTMARVDRLMYGVKMPRLGTADATALSYPLPPLAEQHRIVAKVDELMAMCDQLEAAQKERERRRDLLAAASLQRLNQPAADTTPETRREHARFHLHHLPRLTTRPAHIKAMRQLFLDLAVRGKLVGQDSIDEPASELLQKIRLEKLKQQKGARKKDVRLPSVDLTAPPFDLPSGWAWARFPEVGTFGRGKSKHRPRNDPSLYSGGTHLLVQTGDVARSKGVIKTHTGRYNDVGLAQSMKWPAGTLCITIAANIADSGILSFDACFPDSVVGFKASPLFDSARYFEYFVRTAKANLLAFAPATAQKNINLEILNAVLIPLPPLAEQHRIVARVDSLMALCDQLEAQLTTTQTDSRRLLEAVLDAALEATGATRPQSLSHANPETAGNSIQINDLLSHGR